MSKGLERPAHTRRTENSQLFRIVHDHAVVAADTQSSHGFGKVLWRREHVRVRRRGVLDVVEVEEACVRNAGFFEGVEAISAVVGEKP